MNGPRLILSIALILYACGTPTEPESRLLPVGWWLGEALLQVRESDVILYLTCGAATFARPSIDHSGAFHADGNLKISVGPPPTIDSPGVPATFSGQLSGSTLMLTMNSEPLTHSFTFHFDRVDPGRQTPPTFCP